MKEKYSLQIVRYNHIYYLRAYSVTVVGLRDANGNPIHTLNEEETPKLGSLVLEVLKECKQGIPHPDFSVKQPKSEMLKATGLKSEKEFLKKAEHLDVYLDPDQLEIDPWYFDGKYLSGKGKEPLYCSLDPDDITQTVLKAFEQCHR